MKKITKVLVALTVVLSIIMMFVSCGGHATTNDNFDYIMDYFRDKIVEDEQELIHCDVENNKDGYLLTYSYIEDDDTYVVVITFDDECEITRYDSYCDGRYVDKIEN